MGRKKIETFRGYDGFKLTNFIDIFIKNHQTEFFEKVFNLSDSNLSRMVSGERTFDSYEHLFSSEKAYKKFKDYILEKNKNNYNVLFNSVQNALNLAKASIACCDHSEKSPIRYRNFVGIINSAEKLLYSNTIDDLMNIIYSFFSYFVFDGKTYVMPYTIKKSEEEIKQLPYDEKIGEILNICKTITNMKYGHDKKLCKLTRYTFVKLVEYIDPSNPLLANINDDKTAEELNSHLPEYLKETIEFYNDKKDALMYVKLSTLSVTPDKNMQREAFDALYNSYMSCCENFHEDFASLGKKEINTTISQFVNALAFDGFFPSLENKHNLLTVIDNLIKTHNHHNAYIYPMIEYINGTPILAKADPENELSKKIVELIKKYYYDVAITDSSYFNFTKRFIEWLEACIDDDEINRKFVTDTYSMLVKNLCFDLRIWQKLSSTQIRTHLCENILNTDDLKILQSYTKMHGQTKGKVRVFNILKGNERHLYLNILSTVLNKMESFPSYNHPKICQGLASCFIRIYSHIRTSSLLKAEFEKSLKSILESVNWSKDCYANDMLINCKKWILNEELLVNVISSFDWFEIAEDAVNTEKKDINYIADIIDCVSWNTTKVSEGETKELYKKLVLQLMAFLEKEDSYCDAYKTAIRVRGDKLDKSTADKVDRFRINAFKRYDTYLDLECIKKCVKTLLSNYLFKREHNEFMEQLYINLPKYKCGSTNILTLYELLGNVTTKSNISTNIVKKIISGDVTYEKVITFLITKRTSVENSISPIETWKYVYIYPLLSELLQKDNFLKLNHTFQITLLHFCKHRIEYAKLMLEWVNYIEDNPDAFAETPAIKFIIVSHCDQLVDINCYPNIKKYLIGIINEVSRNLLLDLKFDTFKIYGYSNKKRETFIYHLIKLLKDEPETTALLCAICISKTYGTLIYTSEHPENDIEKNRSRERNELFKTVISNPCIKAYALYYAKMFEAFLHTPKNEILFHTYSGKSARENIKIISNICSGKFPDWFGNTNVEAKTTDVEMMDITIDDFIDSLDLNINCSDQTILNEIMRWRECGRPDVFSPTNDIVIIHEKGQNNQLIYGNKLLSECARRAKVFEENVPTVFKSSVFTIEPVLSHLEFPVPPISEPFDIYKRCDEIYIRIQNLLSKILPVEKRDNNGNVNIISKTNAKDELCEFNYFLSFYNEYVKKKRLLTQGCANLGYAIIIDSAETSLKDAELKYLSSNNAV